MTQVDCDSLVVGAGVIGLALARELAKTGQFVLVLEKAASFGTETSSRNSEVIHAGIYYPKDSLKARFCVEGRELLYDYCASRGVEARRVGKLIVATSRDEEAKLRSIRDLAQANRVQDLQWLTASEVTRLEPEIICTSALLSPATGIVDAGGLMLSLLGEAESSGASFAFNTHFEGAARDAGGFSVSATSEGGEITTLTCRQIYNCAGHGAHDVARRVAGFPVDELPPRFLAKGSYCSVSGKNRFKHLIYPVPVSGALGIHATFDMSGSLRLGPDMTWVDAVDYSLPGGLPEKFSAAVQPYWPGVRDRELSPSYCGIRPKIHGPESSFADFQIQTADAHGISGLFNFFGIESPGLTASLAIAKHVVRDEKENH